MSEKIRLIFECSFDYLQKVNRKKQKNNGKYEKCMKD